MRRVLSLATVHPDDAVHSFGGTIYTYASSDWDIRCVILTRGEAGNASPDVRVRETRSALGILGVPEEHIVFGDYPDTRLEPCHDVIEFLEQAIGLRPDLALIPSPYDLHQDHVAGSLACQRALRRATTVLMGETPSSSYDFRPEVFISLTERALQAKLEAIRCHQTQAHRAYMSPRYVRSLAEVRGWQGRVMYAEAFMPLRYALVPGGVDVLKPPVQKLEDGLRVRGMGGSGRAPAG